MPSTPTTFAGLVNFFIGIIDLLVVLIFGLAFVVVMWKIIDTWIINVNNDTKRAEGKMIAIVAVVVMVIMVGIWSILKVLQRSFFG